jgi:hypothetical protein
MCVWSVLSASICGFEFLVVLTLLYSPQRFQAGFLQIHTFIQVCVSTNTNRYNFLMLKCTWQIVCTGVLFQECLAPWVLPMHTAFGTFSYCICGGYFIWSISLLEKRSDLKPTPWNWEGFLVLPLLRSRLKIPPPCVLHDLCLFWTVITFTWYFMTGKPTGVGHSQNPQLDLTSPSSYAPYFENVQCRGLYPNIIVLEWLPHTLNNFQLDRNFQKKFSPFCRNFQKHIQAASHLWTRDLPDQIRYFTSFWPLTQRNILKAPGNFIEYITHKLKFSELKRSVPNQKFWIKFIIWQRTAEAAQVLLYICVDNSILFLWNFAIKRN